MTSVQKKHIPISPLRSANDKGKDVSKMSNTNSSTNLIESGISCGCSALFGVLALAVGITLMLALGLDDGILELTKRISMEWHSAIMPK